MSTPAVDAPEAVAGKAVRRDLGRETSPSISPAFTSILRERRHAYNYRWSEARSRFPHLTSDDAASFFINDLAPLVNALTGSTPGSITDSAAGSAGSSTADSRTNSSSDASTTITGSAARGGPVSSDRLESICDIAVEIGARATGLRLLGVNASQPWVTRLWRATFPVLAEHIALSPLSVITELSHATAQFSAHTASRPQQWLRLLGALGPQTTDLDQLRLLGKVLAWRSGLAHYRNGALAAADQLPPALVEHALEIPANQSWNEWRPALHQSCWPSSLVGDGGLLGKVGAFRGLGGVFVEPPMLATRNGDLIARSGKDSWLVSTDSFGSTLHRIEDVGISAGVTVTEPTLVLGDYVFVRGQAVELGAAAPVTSAAQQGNLLAITTKNSHAIWLLNAGDVADDSPTGNAL
jgi:hypothetical protein